MSAYLAGSEMGRFAPLGIDTAEEYSYDSAPQLPLVLSHLDVGVWYQDGVSSSDDGHRIFSALGEPIKPVSMSEELLNIVRETARHGGPIPENQLNGLTVSPVTGCWTFPGRHRTHSGYISQADKALGITPSGSSSTHRVMLERHDRETGIDKLTSEVQVDHVCRFTSCSCPLHTRRVSGQENNELKLRARAVETALRTAQLISPDIPTGIESLDGMFELSPLELAKVVISTRYGPYGLEKVEESLVGVPIECSVRESMRPLGRKYPRKHKLHVGLGQLSIAEAA